MKHFIAIDCSGSTDRVTSYWEKVENLVKEITSKEEEFSFIFWNNKAKQIGITEQALQEITSMKGDGCTYPSTFIPFLPQVNDGITLTIFTDGMINETNGVEHCDNLLRTRDIKIKQLNAFFIGDRNSMDLSVIASFLREERIPEKGMVYQQYINASYKKYFFVDPSKELEKYFDNPTLFLEEADKLAEKFDLQNLGRTNQNKIFRNELAKLKNNLLEFILKKEKNKEKTNSEKIEKILKNLKEGKDSDAINNLNNLIDNNPNLALELDTAFKKLFVALDRKDGFQFNRRVTHIHNASTATQESNELLELKQTLNQDSTQTFTENLAIPAAFDNFIIKKLILKRFAEKFPLHSFNKKLFKDEILKLFKETTNSTISKDKILKLFKKTIEALPIENIQEEFFVFEKKMDEVSKEDILKLFEKIKDNIFKNNFHEKYLKLTVKIINEVYNKIDQDEIYINVEILRLLINTIYPDELEQYENFKFMQKIFNENSKEEIEQEEIEAVEVFKLIYKIINEYSKDEILTLIDKKMSKIYQAINLKLFEKTMQDKRLVPTKTEVFDEATQKIISINVSVIDVMTQRFKYFYLNNPTVFLCDNDLVKLAEQSLDLEMKNNKQFPSFISTSTIDQFFGIATSAGERPLWLANLYLIIKNQNQFNQESKLALKERFRDQFCKEENYLTLSNLPEHGPILKVPLIIAIWYIVISPKLIKDFRHNRLRTIGTKYHLDLLDELNLPYNKAETLHRLARYKLFAWMMDLAKENPKKLENWLRSFYQKTINCDGSLIFLDGAAGYDLKTLKIGIFENKGYDTNKISPIICFSNEDIDKAAENPHFVDTLSLSEVHALYKLVDPKEKTEEIDIDSNIDGLLKDPLLSQTFTPVIHYNPKYNLIKSTKDDPTQICHFTLRPYKVSDETIENKFGSKDKQLFAYKYLGNFVAQFEKFPTSDEFLIYMAEKQSQKANPKNTLPAIPIIHKIASNIINNYKEALDHFLLNIDKLQNILKESSLKESKKTEFQNILNKRKCLSEKSEDIQATATANISLFIEITKFFNRAPSEFRDQLEKAGKEISKIPCTLKDELSSLFFNQRRGNELGNQLEKACEEILENQSTLQEETLSMQNTYRKVS